MIKELSLASQVLRNFIKYPKPYLLTQAATLPYEAKKLGFSPSLLRSYSRVYEDLGGRIALSGKGQALYSTELLATFEQVRSEVQQGRAIHEAMHALMQ